MRTFLALTLLALAACKGTTPERPQAPVVICDEDGKHCPGDVPERPVN